MDLSLPRRVILRALDAARSVADAKAAMPVLKNVHLSASDSALTVTASDLLLTYRATLPASVKTPGSVCVPAGILRDVVVRMAEGEIRVTVEKSGVSVRGSGARTATKILMTDGADYASVPLASETPSLQRRTVPANALADVRRLTRYAQSGDNTRPHLEATLIELCSDSVRAVATDGHRLSMASRAIPKTSGYPVGQSVAKLLIPARSLTRMALPESGDLIIEHGSAQRPLWITHAMDGAPDATVTWCSKLVDAAFPSYEQVVPQSWSGHVECPRADLLDALSACASVAQERTSGVRMRPRDTALVLDSENPDAGEISDRVDAICTGTLPKVLSVNGRYLSEVLSALTGDRVTLRMSGSLDPLMVVCAAEGERFSSVIMGMRTGEEG